MPVHDPWKTPDPLGVSFDLDSWQVKVKPDRRKELIEEIDHITHSRMLHPGHASKLRGKLFFLTSALFGRIGRAFMKPLAERQYADVGKPVRGRARYQDFTKQQAYDPDLALGEVLSEALATWRQIIQNGQPRPIPEKRSGPAGAVPCSDGAGPTEEETDVPPKLRAVLCAWWREQPIAFGVEVPQGLMDDWLPRKKQIAMIELSAAVQVLRQWGPDLAGKRVIGLTDSECVPDALVKG